MRFEARVNITSLRKIKKFSNLRSGICLALKRVNHVTPKRVA
ncbi:hypothetical protein HMPREF3230_01151 [Gardnerella vaginalis]|uniref:Uncharacterized protein n=1 Tax=Gardnerella vaginalis TaxID=2702 RepID=A0A135Z3P1_GARVA|nr:hypothetical protein HMPREF3230_01151 [Gardnerella vaginalis]